MSTPQYLAMQADDLEAKGDRLHEKGQNEQAQYFWDEANKLRAQVPDPDPAPETPNFPVPGEQMRLF